MSFTRLVFLGLGFVLLASRVRAQTSAASDTVAFSASDFALTVADSEDLRFFSDDELKRHFGRARCQCGESVLVRLALTQTGAQKLGDDELDAELLFGQDCDDSQAASRCVELGQGRLTARQTRFDNSVGVSRLFAAVATGDDPCTLEGNVTRSLWAVLRRDGERLDVKLARPLSLFGKPPVAPRLLSLEAGDGKATVQFEPPSGTEAQGLRFQALCSPTSDKPQDAAFSTCEGATSDVTSAAQGEAVCSSAVTAGPLRLEGLENGAAYVVTVVAIDPAGTPSAPSNALEVTPEPSIGFQELYTQNGGDALGGCSLAGRRPGRAAWALVGLLLFAAAIRRGRRRRPGGTLMLGVLALAQLGPVLATAAEAEGESAPAIGEEIFDRPAPARVPRWNFALRLGWYRPGIDGEFARRGLAGRPFSETFDGERKVLPGIEIGRVLWSGLGTLSLSGSASYQRMVADAYSADGKGRTADKTGLTIVPLSTSLVYRLEDTRPDKGFLLTPFVRAGLDYFLWRIEGPSKDSFGATAGWHAGAGLQLGLDRLDPEAARGLAQEAGIYGTSLIFQVTHHSVRGLGAKNKLDLGDTVMSVGLGFRF